MDKPNFNRKFLVIPIPEEDEFILSFLNRIKIANAYPSLNSVIKTIFKKTTRKKILILQLFFLVVF